ncbi:Hypothetical predicted protein [Paramuricea clavata]|uniref:Uncharacterized protein n=1 Tax=Paramuricea clavata TaxID=317549 RepID=A0A6S7JAL3_PARCT|nr:Hypothetical predicted protein [Paramuricea clavata]
MHFTQGYVDFKVIWLNSKLNLQAWYPIGNRKQPQETKSKTEAKDSPTIETKSEQEIPSPVPAVEVSSEAAVVAVDGVDTAPESRSSTGSDKVPEIKVVEPSPILKTKSNQDEGESEEVETQNERTEEKVVETDDKEEGGKQTEPVSTDNPPDEMIVISNPLAGGEVKSYTSQSITTTTHTTQSSSDTPADETVGNSSTVISSTQVVTITTETVQSSEGDDDIDIGLV